MKKLLIGVLCGIFCLPCMAEDSWGYAGRRDGQVILYDISTIETRGNIKGTWLLLVNEKTTDDIDYVVIWEEFDCSNNRYKFTAGGTAHTFGKKEYLRLPGRDWQRFHPGTPMAEIHKGVCKKEPYNLNFPAFHPLKSLQNLTLR